MNKSPKDPTARTHRGIPPFGYQQWLMGAVFTAAFLGSCKKDGDTSPPRVNILTPANGSSVQVPGEVLVRAEVEDDNDHVEVVVSISGGDLSGFVPPFVTHVYGNSGIVEAVLVFNDERIVSSDATIIVRATDGTNDGRDFRDLNVVGTPLRRRALFAVNAPPGGPATVHRADSVGNVSAFYSLAMDARDALVSSYHKRLLLIGDVTGPIMGINAETGQSFWSELNQGSGSSTWFKAAMLAPDRRLYQSTRDGGFVAHHAFNGTHEINGAAQADRTISCFGMEGSLLVTQEDGIGGPQRELVLRSTITGAALDVQALDFDVTAMHAGASGHLLLFGGSGGDGRVEDRNLATGLPLELMSLPGETIAAAETDGAGRFWLLLPGRVAAYASGSSSAPTLWAGAASDITYDAADDVLWVANGSDALAIDANTGAVIGSIAFPNTIDHLAVFLNR